MSDKVALLLEDEALIAMDVGQSLMDAGYLVATVTTCSAAQAWLKAKPLPSVAVVDVELSDGKCDEVARELTRLKVPFVVHSGGLTSKDDPDSEAFTAGTWLSKPSLTADLLAAVDAAVSGRAP